MTEEKKLRISENCTVYVLVTDQKGNTYEKNRAIKCFDTVKPTLNAAVSDGLLSIQVHDTDSGAKAVYVNGYEFTDLTGGTLNIRLQQFDAGYDILPFLQWTMPEICLRFIKRKIRTIKTLPIPVMGIRRSSSRRVRPRRNRGVLREP